MSDLKKPFQTLFVKMLRTIIRENPRMMIPYMKDSGVQGPIRDMIMTLIEKDADAFSRLLFCLDDKLDDLVEMVSSEYCFDFYSLSETLNTIRTLLIDGSEIKTIEHPEYGHCCSTTDGSAIYSSDLTELIHVDGDVTSFTVPDTVTKIRDHAFEFCGSLCDVTIPSSIESIGEKAFSCCIYASIHIGPDEISLNGRYRTNEGCLYESIDGSENHGKLLVGYNLARSRTCIIPDSVVEIGRYAFHGCSYMEELFIPDSVTSIGEGAFLMCDGLQGVRLPQSITEVPPLAFCDCECLEEINIPGTIISIGDRAFEGCKALKDVIFNGNIVSIGSSAFKSCASLRVLSIPSSITEIGDTAFGHCPDIVLHIGSTDVSSDGRLFVKNGSLYSTIDDSYDSLRLIVGYGLVENGRCTVPDSVRIIGNGSFSGCRSVESVLIPDSVKVINDNAFSFCKSLRDVDLPDSIVSIGDGAFFECESLSHLNLPDSVTHLGKYVFAYTSLEDLIIPDSVTSIGKRTFENCDRLHRVVLSHSIVRMEDAIFIGCSSLEIITIPDSVTDIGSATFMNCRSLKEIDIPDSVTSIGKMAFYDCPELEKAIVPEGLCFDDVFPYYTKIVYRQHL